MHIITIDLHGLRYIHAVCMFLESHIHILYLYGSINLTAT
jgi:hypothetical protein